jgi:hypothetical protein
MASIDIVVPCYKYGHFLRDCVTSVLNQNIHDVRVLIIDDASPDNTAEVGTELAKEDSRVTFSRHSTNQGHIATYNEGIEWVSADYMVLLSADDYLLPGALIRSVTIMDEHPEVGFTFGTAVTLDDCGTIANTNAVTDKRGWRILTGPEFVELSGCRNIVPTPTVVVRTELQKRVGGYRPELPHSGDMEMWLRLATHASVGMLEACQGVYRQHASNMALTYMKDYALADLQQRKAALECFFQDSGFTVPSIQRLHHRIFRSLACDAVGFASGAFNDGELGASERCSEFALSICPEVKRSLPWLMLACKRRIGSRAWRALQPVVAGFRKAALELLPPKARRRSAPWRSNA